MRQSQLFTKTRREAPRDEVSRNAQLLIRAGFIHKEMAGVYDFLPLGLRVLNKVVGIIRDEMLALGGQEVKMSALQNKELWEATDRWDDKKVDVWFKTKFKNDQETGLAITHEEPLTKMLREHVSSWRDLPVYLFQFQTKFRNETRAKSGILRTREFLMKDLYSFCRDEKEQSDFYEKAKRAYFNIFKKVGLSEKTYLTFASGGSFSKFSHEFQTLTDAGEDVIYLCQKCHIGVNEEIFDEQKNCPQCGQANFMTGKAIEVGNIFNLGLRFSQALGLAYRDEKGKEQPVFMGSYGIGPAGVMGAVVEVMSDEKGLVWPETIAPFKYHIIDLTRDKSGEKLYKTLGDSALYDDRSLSAGEKFADADLIGIPNRVVVSDKTVQDGTYEVKNRKTKKKKNVKEII